MLRELNRAVRAWWNIKFHRGEVDKGLKELDIKQKDGEYHARAVYESTPAMAIFAQELCNYLDAHNAPNWVQMNIFDPATMGRYILTVQRYERPSPAQVISYLRPIVEHEAASGNEQAANALNACGYPVPSAPV